ncbi:MAG: transporter [Negativicutes bacterium]|nr:transporter [Negativicutes bacterium]
MKRMLFVFHLLVCCLILGQNTARATEGASSYYFPGAATTFATAVAPAPGLMVANQMLYYSGKADVAVLRGYVHLNLKAEAFYNYVGGFYTFAEPVLGGRLQIGAVVPVGYSSVQANVGTPFHAINAADSKTDIGDSVVSAALYWGKGNYHYKLVESVFAPTGGYTAGALANVGRNYWAYDTSLAMTWLNAKTGTEISVTPGIMFNKMNDATNYKSGNEFHVDLALNQFLTQNFAVGLHGYYYRQVTGDSGSGAVLGSFEGNSRGIGPAVLWMPKAGKGDLSVVAKWLHDLDQKNRMHGDYGQLTVGYKF